MRKVFDLLGKEIKVGDKVAWPCITSTSNATLEYGEVISIIECPEVTRILCETIKSGYTSYNNGELKRFRYEEKNYPKLIKIS